MRARQRLCCMAILGICLAGSGSAQQTVQWQPTLETAKRIAGQTGRLVLIHFWDDGCPPCQMMERDVYSRADVAAAIDRDFVAVKVKRSHFPASASQYGVSGVPADVIITPRGQLIERSMGAVSASQYMSRLNQISSNWRRSSQTAGYAQNSSLPPQGPAQPPLNARPAYRAPPANTGPANGFAARATQQRRAQGPPAMEGRYPGGATGDSRNQQFAARQPERPVYSPGREALGPPPQLGYSPANPESQVAQRRLAPYESNRQPVPSSEPAIEIPAGNPPVALDGYCPVQLAEKKRWVVGNRRWGLRHEGRTYLFAGPDEQRRFNENPDGYAPVMSGNDVVLLVNGGQSTAGRRECGAWFMGRMFLFSDETSFQKFEANPDYYATAVKGSVSSVANRNAAPPASRRPWDSRK